MPLFRLDPAYRKLRLAFDEVTPLLEEPADRLTEVKPVVSRWSVAQHLLHLAAVNDQVLANLEQLPDHPDATPDGRPNVAGYLVLVAGRFPRGRGRSPRAFIPPEDPSVDEAEAAVAKNRERVAALEAHLQVLKQTDLRLPHPLLGDFTPGTWLRFMQLHTRHHAIIARDILSYDAS